MTLRLRSAAWDFVLDHIARKHDLKIVREADRIRLSGPYLRPREPLLELDDECELLLDEPRELLLDDDEDP